jgi:hypothetical protein
MKWSEESQQVTLADENIDDESLFYEGFQYAVSEGVEAVIGKRLPRKAPHPSQPAGDEWVEDTVADRYPKLSEKFG